MKRYFFCLFLLLSLTVTLCAQHDHASLRKEYVRIKDDDSKADSALYYSFKIKDAALKEFGDTSFEYIRALNNIGAAYTHDAIKKFRESRYWWQKAYKQFSRISERQAARAAFVLDNFRVCYTYHFPNTDSIFYYYDQYVNLKIRYSGISRSLIADVCNAAYDMEELFGLDKADHYYAMILDMREAYYGHMDKVVIRGLDSVARAEKYNNNRDYRDIIYNVPDSAYSYEALDSLSRATLWSTSSGTSIMLSHELMCEAMKRSGDTSGRFIIALSRMGLAHNSNAAAFFCLETGLGIVPQNNVLRKLDLLTNLAYIYREDRQFDQSKMLASRVLSLSDSVAGKESALYADALQVMADHWSYSSVFDERVYLESLGYMQEYVRLYAKFYGDTSREYGTAVQTRSALYLRWARLDSALQGFRQAWDLLNEKNSYKDNYSLARQIYMTYYYLDEQAKSTIWLQKCLDMSRARGDTLNYDYFQDLHNLFGDYHSLNDPERAGSVLQQMQVIVDRENEKNSRMHLYFLARKADFESMNKRDESADSILQYLLNVYSDSSYFVQDHPETFRRIAEISGNLTQLYIRNKKYDAALKSNLLSIRKMMDVGFSMGDNVLSGEFTQRALIMDATEQYDSAVHYYKVALKAMENANNEHYVSYQETKINLANVCWKQGGYEQAAQLMSEACHRLHQTVVRNMAGFSEKEKQAYIQVLQKGLHQYFSLMHSMPSLAGITTTAYDLRLQSRGLLFNTSEYLEKTIHASGDTLLQYRYQELKNLRKLLARAYAAGGDGTGFNTDSLEAEAGRAEQWLSFSSTGFNEFITQSQVSFKDVSKRLEEGEAAIEFIAFPYYDQGRQTDSMVYGAFVITSESEKPLYIKLDSAGKTEKMLKDQGVGGRGGKSKELIDPKHKTEKRPASLYEYTWQPLEQSLAKSRKLYIAADGILNRISFAGLQDSNKQYLIDRYELHHLVSTAEIARSGRGDIKGNPSIALFGGAEYDLKNPHLVSDSMSGNRSLPDNMRGGTSWDYLENTLTEVKEIGKSLRKWKVSTYTGAAASETNFKTLTGDRAHTILHIATHGFYFPPGAGDSSIYRSKENPLLRTGLVFSAANEAWLGRTVAFGNEDGILTAYELANMDLASTRLIVLSACETGIGDVMNGEGVFGLQRAIRQAGIRNMIVSLWSVPDKETAEMMQAFYASLSKDPDITKAFYKAQSLMRKRYPTQPALWAGFILIE